MTVTLQPGQWVVWNESSYEYNPRYAAAMVESVAALTLRARRTPTSPKYVQIEQRRILFTGSEEDARRLVERLTSSVALMDNDIRHARNRHADRVKKLTA